ncbi:MAG: hypothetical protein ACJAR1_002362 [Rubritalea sp.]|jgi:hypothetical protein
MIQQVKLTEPLTEPLSLLCRFAYLQYKRFMHNVFSSSFSMLK